MDGFNPDSVPSAKPRRISEIEVDDEQVQVIGFIVDKKESSLILDDGSGELNILFEDPGLIEDVEVGSKVRVFGTPLSIEDTQEIHAEIIQDMEGLDLDLYKRALEEVRKFEKELEQ